VHDTAQAADAAQAGGHFIEGASRMHDHRQVVIAGEFKLGVEVVVLLIAIESFDEQI
jgi:hypothetical protein